MRILGRYLRREVVGATMLVLLAFLCLFAFFDFLAELEEIGKGGYQLKHALIFVTLSIPSRAYEVMPIAALIGTLYALTHLARNSELAVLRTAGVSNARMLALLAQIGLLFVAATFILGEYVAPPLERVAQKWRLRSTSSSVPQELRTGMWVRDGRLFVNIRRVQPDASLNDVRIFEFDDAHRLVTLNQATKGVYSPQSGWLLSDVTQTRFHGSRTEILHLPDLRWSSELTPEMISVVMVSPERMAIGSLHQYVRHLEDNKQRAGRYGVAFWKKIIYPFASLVMMWLALPFALSGNQRSGNVGARVMTGVMLGIGFYLLNGLFSNLGVINSWPPLVSACVPSIVFLILAIVLMWGVDRK